MRKGGRRMGHLPVPGHRCLARPVVYKARWLLRRLRLAEPREARILFLMMAGVLAVILANTFGQVRLNQWQGAFYNALERRDFGDFLIQLGVFFAIVAGLLVLVVAQTWVTETMKVRARRWLTTHVIDSWLKPRRAYLLGFAGDIGRNPDQRIAEDAGRLTDLSIGLSVGLGQSSLLLVSFLGVLWTLSTSVVFAWHGSTFTIPGYMVWSALVFSAVGSLLTYLVGRPLIAGNAERFAREGELRTALVRVSENSEVISLERGEPGERQVTIGFLGTLIAVMQRLANARARLTWVTSGYGWIGLVVPIVVAAPGFFAGNMTLGGLIMVVGGFNQVQNALRWFIDNYPSIAEWQACLQRVTLLLDSLESVELHHDQAGRIALAASDGDTLVLDGLAVCLPGDLSTCILLADRHLEIVPGDRVLFVGAQGSGKTTLFMALAGLWPWGRGTIRQPQPFDALFLPERPYLPEGTLRRALAYPEAGDKLAVSDVAAALHDVGLAHLVAELDVANHWDKDLSLDDQQRLSIARILLRRPRWAMLDDCLSALDDKSGRDLLAILRNRLPSTAIVSTSHRGDMDHFYARVIELGGVASLPPFTLEGGVAKPQAHA
ncbi:MAG: ABC transporter ATP-binding protein/permease [Rhizobiales bacterium]|nr:ABC transporter ATP-binding protein/permease [Hyphomicrobiales bacterium]